MIYPEFRLHSILFAIRSVVCFYLAYYEFGVLYKMVACMITMHLADIATDVCRPSAAETTTMRNMPFDKEVDEEEEGRVRFMAWVRGSSGRCAQQASQRGHHGQAKAQGHPVS